MTFPQEIMNVKVKKSMNININHYLSIIKMKFIVQKYVGNNGSPKRMNTT